MTDKMSASFLLFFLLSSSVLPGCDQFDSKVPTEKLLVDTLVGYSKKHDGVYEFQNIKKLDGQLQPDGLHYIMEYQATFKTNSCFKLPILRDADYGEIDFGKSIDKSPDASHCSEKRVLAYAKSGVYLISDLQSLLQPKALFTKKESGWQLLATGITANSFGPR